MKNPVLARIQEPVMKGVNYKEILNDSLGDPEQAAEYLTACYEEGFDIFLVGLRDVLEAHEGIESRFFAALKEFASESIPCSVVSVIIYMS